MAEDAHVRNSEERRMRVRKGRKKKYLGIDR